MGLFAGSQKSHGLYSLTGETTEAGKAVGKARTIQKAATQQDYSDHLMGECGLGVVPVTEESTARFGAIDVDQYPIELDLVNCNIRDLKLPLVACRTKSGGAHLYLFTDAPVAASLIQRKLREMAALMGYGSSEIFPKQSKVLTERGDSGSWINLPYFGCGKGPTLRYALGEKDVALSMEDFYKYACKKMVPAAQLEKLKFALPQVLPEGPPCLQQLVAHGFPAGTRNNGLMNLGVYFKKAYGDAWEKHLEDANNRYLKPPLTTDELAGVMKSLRKKEYGYTCKQQPIQAFCNAGVCRTCRHGVGGADLGMPKSGTLTKLNTVPPLWFMDIETELGPKRVEFSTEELQSPLKYQLRCLAAADTLPFLIKKEIWQAMIMGLLKEMNVIEVPVETTPAGQFMLYLSEFCVGGRTAANQSEMILGRPWENGEDIHFRWTDLLAHLDRKKFKLLEQNQMMQIVRDMPGYKRKFHNIKGTGLNVVVLPKKELIKAQTEAFDVTPQPEEML